MSWTLATTACFDRRARKFLTKHPDLRPRFAETLAKLAEDPFQPGLRLHALSGKLQGIQAVSLTLQLPHHAHAADRGAGNPAHRHRWS